MKMHKVMVTGVILTVVLCSCAQKHNGHNPAENKSAAKKAGVGGFHPGIFWGNRINDVKGVLNQLTDSTAKEYTDEEWVPPVAGSEIAVAENQKNVQLTSPVVHIKRGPSKKKNKQ